MGKPLSIGNFVNSGSPPSLIFSFTTNTYSPYIDIGDDAYPDGSHDEVIRGTDYQEALTNFPLVSQFLTGLFLDVTLSGPQGPNQTFEKTLADRIGYDVRQNGGSPNLSISADSPPLVNPFEVWSMSVLPACRTRRPPCRPRMRCSVLTLTWETRFRRTIPRARVPDHVLSGQTRAYVDALLGVRAFTRRTGGRGDCKAYLDRPRSPWCPLT